MNRFDFPDFHKSQSHLLQLLLSHKPLQLLRDLIQAKESGFSRSSPPVESPICSAPQMDRDSSENLRHDSLSDSSMEEPSSLRWSQILYALGVSSVPS
ncbi:hypothetical protein AALP_AAs72305U000100 [Arabis alpina]|uniref:Uncharacterized protein n=1 Tax=Arabis alpina TaxID=50452 RepID=A0A087FW73_ARAAL|nr:hypothetical protein AALP_AAs72305U000100 [Arabis alpina]